MHAFIINVAPIVRPSLKTRHDPGHLHRIALNPDPIIQMILKKCSKKEILLKM